MDNRDEKRVVIPLSDSKKKPSPPFRPLTGNPEAHDYADFVRSLKEGEIVKRDDYTK